MSNEKDELLFAKSEVYLNFVYEYFLNFHQLFKYVLVHCTGTKFFQNFFKHLSGK